MSTFFRSVRPFLRTIRKISTPVCVSFGVGSTVPTSRDAPAYVQDSFREFNIGHDAISSRPNITDHVTYDGYELNFCYKFWTVEQWEERESAKKMWGSDHDKQDGFIHMCTVDQCETIAKRYFGDESEFVICKLDINRYCTVAQDSEFCSCDSCQQDEDDQSAVGQERARHLPSRVRGYRDGCGGASVQSG